MMVGQNETHWLYDVRRLGQHDFALAECFAHQTKFILLKIAKTAVNEFAAGRRRRTGQIVLFAKTNRQSPSCRIAGDPGSVDTTADDQKVKRRVARVHIISNHSRKGSRLFLKASTNSSVAIERGM